MRLSVFCGLALLFATSAVAQQSKTYTGTATTGHEIEFDHELNYDEASCQDHGYARIGIQSPPQLGKLTIRRARVRTNTGPCAGKQLSVVVIYYRAGNRPGMDTFNYTINGENQIFINATVTVN